MFSKQIEKKETQPQVIPLPNSSSNNKGVVNLSDNLKASSTQEQNFFLSLGAGDYPFDMTDNTILWKYNIPSLVPGERRRIIEVVHLSASLINYKSPQFPLKLGLEIENVTGYQSLKWVVPQQQGPAGWQTVPTDICAWSLARAITGTKEEGGITSYNVSYELGEEQNWQVGMMNTITLRLVDGDYNRIAAPFNNPVQLHLRILHLGQ